MSLKMTQDEREAFLADLHVGVISIEDAGRGPLSTPIWYGYKPSVGLWVITARTSRKGIALDKAGRFSLVAQTEEVPYYKYVSVEGPIVTIEAADLERDTRPIAHRYLGREFGDRYVEATGGAEERTASILVRMRPERWLSVDYSKQFAPS